MEKLNETFIKRKLFLSFNNFDYKLFNVYVFQNESDFLAVSKSGYVWEVEIKISRADFKNDFKKTNWNGIKKHKVLTSENSFLKPNKFCFAVPEGLIEKNEVPDYAGLIYVAKNKDCQIIKQPKFLHKNKLFENNTFLKRMLSKFYYRHSDLRDALDLREWDIKYRQVRIEFNRWKSWKDG